MIKIGLTIPRADKLNERLTSNGLYQNIIFFYDYFNKQNSKKVYLISDGENKEYNYINIYDYSNLITLDFIIEIGLILPIKINNAIFSKVKLIKFRLGNDHIYDLFHIFSGNSNNISIDNLNKYNETWILPDYKYSIDYYKYIDKTKIHVGPFIWSPKYMPKKLKNTNMDQLNAAIFEPNSNYGKNCFIPIIICDKAFEYINKVLIMGSRKLAEKKNNNFLTFCKLSKLFREGKMTCEARWELVHIMENYCNIIISYNDNWDLNYISLECFYLGIPLIHNSEMLKDWGYYYPKCNVDIAVNHLKSIKENGFNRQEYINRHKPLLHKYSMDNIDNVKFFESRLIAMV
jgi:hypothetical protein